MPIYPKPARNSRDADLRRQQVRGLLWLAAIVLVIAILRAGVRNVLLPGWWRVW